MQGGEECIDALVLSEAVLAVQENVLVMLYDGAVKHPFGQVLGEDLSGFDTFGSFLRLICPFPLGASASLACRWLLCHGACLWASWDMVCFAGV